jgi:hypothetical protein
MQKALNQLESTFGRGSRAADFRVAKADGIFEADSTLEDCVASEDMDPQESIRRYRAIEQTVKGVVTSFEKVKA